jgi:hypothetical protein
VIVRTAPLLLTFAVVVVAACGDDDSSDPSEPHDVPVLEIDASAESVCLDVTEDLPDEVETLPVIDCAEPHSHEIYMEVEYDVKDVYPGEEELGSFAQVECLREFETFVGISAFDSSLTYTWIVPSLDGWNKDDDRTVLCVLTNGEAGEDLKGSMGASDR